MSGIEIELDNLVVFVLIMIRMVGMLVLNPIFARRNVPTMVNTALAFVSAVVLYGNVPAPALLAPNVFILTFWVAKELLVGFVAGFILRMFSSLLIVSGELVDMQLGMSMAKAFDPGSNASISLSSQIFNILFTLLFFISNSHLTFIHMTAQSFYILPMGGFLVDFDAFYLIPQLFSNMLLLAAKLAIPIAAIEIIVTFAVGIIMRIIPQINVFVVNIQFKLLFGIFVLVLLVPSYTAFMENIIQICIENIQTVWTQLGAP